MQENEQLFQIAQMYYEQNLTQEEISKKVHISRSNISKMLKRARNVGIVEIVVHCPQEEE